MMNLPQHLTGDAQSIVADEEAEALARLNARQQARNIYTNISRSDVRRAASRARSELRRTGWHLYQCGGSFTEDLSLIASLVSSTCYEWMKCGERIYVRRAG